MNELLRKCCEILGLNEDLSEGEIQRAFVRLRNNRHDKDAGAEGGSEQWEKLKEITWARDTLVEYLRTHGPLPAPDAERKAAGEKNPALRELPAYKVDASTPADRGGPWWLSSVGVIALALLLSGLFYMYRPTPHTPKQRETSASANSLTPAEQASPSPSAPRPPDKEAPQLLQEVKKAVVTLRFGTHLGSGFLVSEDGYLVTNFHVVDGVKGSAQFSTGDTVDVNVVKIAPESDIALLKTASGSGYPFLRLGDSGVCREGDAVIAVGSPQGLQSTFTKGIISAKDRRFPGSAVSFLQTDAAINHGNSGGPLINAAGEVIGINTGTIEKSVAEGLNFAIAINDVKGFIEDGRTVSEAERARGGLGYRDQDRAGGPEEGRRWSNSAGKQAIDTERELDRRYGEKMEAMKEHLAKAQKRQALDRCMLDVEGQAQQVWSNACATLSQPAGCKLPRPFVYSWKESLLNAQQQCVNYYGE